MESEEKDKTFKFVFHCVAEKLVGHETDLTVTHIRRNLAVVLTNLFEEDWCKQQLDKAFAKAKPKINRQVWQPPHLQSNLKKDVETVFEALQNQDLPPDLLNALSKYMAYKKTYGPALQRHVATHGKIMQVLMAFHSNAQACEDLIPKLLALTFWLFMFYQRLAKKTGRAYNRRLHEFLSDFLVTLLALSSLLHCPENDIPLERPCNLSLLKTVPHLHVSPHHPVFQLLVLKQMARILNIRSVYQYHALTIDIVDEVYHAFRSYGQWLWLKQGSKGILRIIKDQSRYMSLRETNLRKNFVAQKTNGQLAAILTEPSYRDPFKIIPKEHFDSGRYLPRRCTKPYEEIEPKPYEGIEKALNRVHHNILYKVARELLGDRCPQQRPADGWLEVPQLQEFVIQLAQKVIEEAQKAIAPSESGEIIRKRIADIAVSLQQIIAARCYVSDAFYPSTIQEDQIRKQHQDVVFLFVAFRAVLLFLLPQNPSGYGVQQVAQTLPNYAAQLRLDLHLHVFD